MLTLIRNNFRMRRNILLQKPVLMLITSNFISIALVSYFNGLLEGLVICAEITIIAHLGCLFMKRKGFDKSEIQTFLIVIFGVAQLVTAFYLFNRISSGI